MSLFNNILEKITKNLKDKELNKDFIAKEISNIIGVEINQNNFSIKNNNIYFKISPTIKSIIILKKEILLTKLSKFNIKSIQ